MVFILFFQPLGKNNTIYIHGVKKHSNLCREQKHRNLCRAIIFYLQVFIFGHVLSGQQKTQMTSNSKQCRHWQLSAWNMIRFMQPDLAHFSTHYSRSVTHWTCMTLMTRWCIQITSRDRAPGLQVTRSRMAGQEVSQIVHLSFLCASSSLWMRGKYSNSSATWE